jgi:hypothetical protein
MSVRIDLKQLETMTRAAKERGEHWKPEVASDLILSLSSRAQELEAALRETDDAFGMLADHHEPGTPLLAGRRATIRALLEKGAVLP